MTQGKGASIDAVVIRRYGNRRLYDTRASCYVNLADLRELVRKGGTIRVLDAKTDEDVTRRVLTQIVLETAAEKDEGLPLDLLYELARASDRAFREFLDWYLKSSLQVYRDLQQRWQADAQRRWGEARPALEAWAQLWDPRQVAASLAQLMSPFDRRPGPPGMRRTGDSEQSERGPEGETPSDALGAEPQESEPPAAPAPSSGALADELAELRRRLDQLERRVRAAPAPTPNGRARRARPRTSKQSSREGPGARPAAPDEPEASPGPEGAGGGRRS